MRRLERRMPGVGNRDPHADPRGAQLLAAQNGPDHALHVAVGELAGLMQAADHFPDRVFLAGRLQVHDDCLGPQNPITSSTPPSTGRQA